jgi:hypothetical protein
VSRLLYMVLNELQDLKKALSRQDTWQSLVPTCCFTRLKQTLCV